MLVNVFVFIIGLGILYFGAEWLVKGASAMAIHFGIRPLVVGLTVVALGTSMPEFLLNVFAVTMGEDGLAVGNIVGSNIANIALILGISSVILPLAVGKPILNKEYPMMLGVTIGFYLLALDGRISRTDGGILILGLVAFLYYLIRDSRLHRAMQGDQKKVSKDVFPDDPAPPTIPAAQSTEQTAARPSRQAALLVGGIVALAVGARLMVDSAVQIAEYFDIPSIVIGLTIVAIGTSLPELAASLIGVIRKESDLSVGNILGSNMLNILFVVGFVALIRPMAVEPMSVSMHFPIMIGVTALLFPLARRGYQLNRISGCILLAVFASYLGWLIIPYL